MASFPKVGVGCNAQVAFDAKHKLIVEQHVTNDGSDLGLLAQPPVPPSSILTRATLRDAANGNCQVARG